MITMEKAIQKREKLVSELRQVRQQKQILLNQPYQCQGMKMAISQLDKRMEQISTELYQLAETVQKPSVKLEFESGKQYSAKELEILLAKYVLNICNNSIDTVYEFVAKPAQE